MEYVVVIGLALILAYVIVAAWGYREPKAYCRHCGKEITFVAWVPVSENESRAVWSHIKTGWSNCQPWRSPGTVAEVRK